MNAVITTLPGTFGFFVSVLMLACAARIPEPLTTAPPPLATRPFHMPEVQKATLSNGLAVAVVENHRVPMVWIELDFDVGGATDPKGQEGLASVTLDMLNEGAGTYDAEGLSAALRKMASTLDSGAGLDGATIGMSCLKNKLEPTLDLMTTVLFQPTFPAAEWAILKDRRLADLKDAFENPERIANRVFNRVMYGNAYMGRSVTEASLGAIGPDAMRAWWSERLVPGNALLLVGGDITLAEAVPLLEKRFGSWKSPTHYTPPVPEVSQPEGIKLYAVDKPDAPQSVLRMGRFVNRRGDADWFDLMAATMAWGGTFTSRVNMNLREDKGWTYGARAGTNQSLAPACLVVSTAVKRENSADAVREILAEAKTVAADKPFSVDEIRQVEGYLFNSWPALFEQTSWILGQTADMWRYHLPADWLSSYRERLSKVNASGAEAAWLRWIPPQGLAVVVVGDLKVIRESLAGLGYPIVELDRMGEPVLPPKAK
jgi:zinc protease